MCSDCCGEEGECHPLGFILGLPFAFVCLILSLIGAVIWIVGGSDLDDSIIIDINTIRNLRPPGVHWILLSCLCPCCICVTAIVELALCLVKAPFSVMKWFTKQIPC